jgi:hypothetical protein
MSTRLIINHFNFIIIYVKLFGRKEQAFDVADADVTLYKRLFSWGNLKSPHR